MTENFSQISVGHQTTDVGSSDNNKQDKCQTKNKKQLSVSFSNYKKSKIMKNKSSERNQWEKHILVE